MTNPYGIIDLGTLKKPEGGPGGAAGAPSAHETTVTVQNIEQVVGDSQRVATLLLATSNRLPEAAEYLQAVRRQVDARGGALRLAVVDADAQPQVAQAMRIQSVPAMMLLLMGQVQPMFEGVVSEQELSGVLDQVLQIAQQQGLAADGADAADGTQDEETKEPLTPLQQEAYDAIEAGDLDRAERAYEQMLTENPADAEARAGQATVRLMRRTEGADLAAARTAAAEAPGDLDAQLLAADLDLLGGHVEDAFARLLDQLRGADQDTKDAVRARLLELFEVVGGEDARVAAARKRLANLLF
ncbi:MAG: tetratricopeptide repeat protein [Brachybacterium sp.]|nr:tetratricopeptide repeat protein [Brachybacterium sp.]